MSTNDASPDLSKLDKDYQILTELPGEGEPRSYLARHLRLNRDVTITIVRSDDPAAIAQFAADARLLMTLRHPNVVPVIDGVSLDDKTFAIVRARVRGSTVEQLIASTGPIPIGRVFTTVNDVNAAVTWARESGVAHRDIAARDVVFQQGSGRVLLAFELSHANANTPRDACDDAHTIGRLAGDMLSGEIAGRSAESPSGVVVPPRIVPSVAEAIEAVRTCDQGNAASAMQWLLSALEAAATPPASRPTISSATAAVVSTPADVAAVADSTPVPERVVPPVVERAADARQRPAAGPIRTGAPTSLRDEPVAVVKPSFGFNARLATAAIVIAVIAVLGVLVLHHDNVPNRIAAADTADTANSAAGEVVPRSVPDSGAMVPSGAEPSTPAPVVSAPAAQPSPKPSVKADSVSPTGEPDTTRPRITVPETRHHEPPKTAPSVTFPMPPSTTSDSAASAAKKPADSAAAAERKFQRDSAADVADACLSPAAEDQHSCLMNAIDRNDRTLNNVYARLISALRRQAGSASADPDPDNVNELRAAQRKWIDERDAACRNVGDAPFYAKSRASCFAQQSADRVRELERMLNAVPPVI